VLVPGVIEGDGPGVCVPIIGGVGVGAGPKSHGKMDCRNDSTDLNCSGGLKRLLAAAAPGGRALLRELDPGVKVGGGGEELASLDSVTVIPPATARKSRHKMIVVPR